MRTRKGLRPRYDFGDCFLAIRNVRKAFRPSIKGGKGLSPREKLVLGPNENLKKALGSSENMGKALNKGKYKEEFNSQ